MKLSVFQTILLAVFGSLAIAGILIFSLVVSGGNQASIGPVTMWGTFDETVFKDLLGAADDIEKDISSVTYIQKDPATYMSGLTDAMASGVGPDLFILRQDYILRDSKKVAPVPYTFLSQSQFRDTFVEAASPYLGTQGVLGIPIFVDPMVMYWNRDLLSGAGLAKPPQYWDELPGMVQKLVKRDDSGAIVKAAVSFGEYANVQNAKDLLSLLILQAGGKITRLDTDNGLVPALSAGVGGGGQAAESAIRFYTEFADPSKVTYSWNRSLPNSLAAFAAGDLALYFGYASEVRTIAATNPNLNFAIAPVPQRKGAEGPTNVARVYALATSRTGANPQGAMTVASLMAGSQIGQLLSASFGIPSARRDVLAENNEGDNPVIEREALIAQSWIDPNPERTNAIFRAMIEGVVSGSVRLSDAIQRADQEMAQLIGQ